MTKNSEKENQIEKVKLKNSSFETYFLQEVGALSIFKLKMSLPGIDAFEFDKFIKRIFESIECKTYMETRKDILDKFKEKCKENDKPVALTSENIPEWKSLMEFDSGLSIEKHVIKASSLNVWKDPEKDLNGIDMNFLEVELIKWV